MYINIGAYVGDGSFVDSHALVGSCAQIGKKRAPERRGADWRGARAGGCDAGHRRGRRPRRRQLRGLRRRHHQASRGARRGSDRDRIHAALRPGERRRSSSPSRGSPWSCPKRAVVVPGARAVTAGQGARMGPLGGHPGDRQVPRREDRRAHGARGMDSVDVDLLDVVALTRALSDIDSTTGREAETGAPAGRRCSANAAIAWRSSRWPAIASTCSPRSARRREVVFSTHYDCVPPFFPTRIENGVLFGRGVCDAKGILAAQVAATERLRQAGERRIGLLYVVGEERGSDGAKVANELAPPGVRFLINGEPTDNRLGLATRGMLRVRLVATRPRGPLVVSRAGRVGHRQAARRADGGARPRAARRSRARTHALHRRASSTAAWRPTSCRRTPRPS